MEVLITSLRDSPADCAFAKLYRCAGALPQNYLQREKQRLGRSDVLSAPGAFFEEPDLQQPLRQAGWPFSSPLRATN